MDESVSAKLDQRARRKAQLVQLRFSSIWLVFLTIPAALVASFSAADQAWDWVAYGALVVFAVVYVVGFAIVPENLLHADVATAPRWGRFITLLLVLLALTALTVPSLRESVIAMLPFFAGYGLFLLPIRAGLVWTGVTIFALFVIFWAFGAEFNLGLVLGPLLSIGFVLIIRLMTEWGAVEERTKLELAAVKERDEVSRDVHDILGHTLTVVSLKAQLARRMLHEDPARAEAELDAVLEHTQTALDEVRTTVGRLRVPDLASQLSSAKTALDTKDISLTVRGRPNEVAVEYRVLFAWAVREAVTNIVRHADASACTIALTRCSVAVEDNGVGTRGAEGNGLSGLRRRVEDAGGRLSVTRGTRASGDVPASGTTLEVRLP